MTCVPPASNAGLSGVEARGLGRARLCEARGVLEPGAGGDVQELKSVAQQFPEDGKDWADVTLPNASKRRHGKSASHKSKNADQNSLKQLQEKGGSCIRSRADRDPRRFLRSTGLHKIVTFS